ncbi:YcaO-like family protein [Desulfohalovibrio reitneri]|uniref:YcaO-like family protein n=1 Tax=Desulfohalovibrio reitneri TaxID=1307759 RepID=UPI0004A75464|nr:YcaO-like family protein [Desulfohalovibrio reitneri]
MRLTECPKVFTRDLDKALPPEETVKRARAILEEKAPGVLRETRRVDTGRLGIPVYMSMYGPAASGLVPFRKQMGKGASPEQAEASALMELVERYSFFSLFADEEAFVSLTWSEAEELFGQRLMPISQVLASVGDDLDEDAARAVLDLVKWRFRPALRVGTEEEVIVPADWFKLLNEFNGSSAGNAPAEAVLQGACEAIERHVSAVVDRDRPELPTIEITPGADPVLDELLHCFAAQGIKVVLKDFSLGLPAPTVGAVAWDPATFPALSEIVFTAGTASSPAKAAIRALTEVAQLAGDFRTASRYEPSGLYKPLALDDIGWLRAGPTVPLESLPDLSAEDIRAELTKLAEAMEEQDLPLYALDLTRDDLDLPAAYVFAPGLAFRERSKHPSIGLYVGRRLAEEEDLETAVRGLKALEEHYPQAHFLAFFEGLAALASGDARVAFLKFETAAPMQPGDEETALANFYAAYALTQLADYQGALPFLDRAIELDTGAKEYFNLRGVCRFRQHEYDPAAADFQSALELDSGSAMDLANLGLCRKQQGRLDEAADHLRQALDLDPSLDFAVEQLRLVEEAGGR